MPWRALVTIAIETRSFPEKKLGQNSSAAVNGSYGGGQIKVMGQNGAIGILRTRSETLPYPNSSDWSHPSSALSSSIFLLLCPLPMSTIEGNPLNDSGSSQPAILAF